LAILHRLQPNSRNAATDIEEVPLHRVRQKAEGTMNFKGTVERLEGLLDARNDRQNQRLTTVRNALDRLIEAQVERVQVRVLFYTLDGLDFFNTREFGPETFLGVEVERIEFETANDAGFPALRFSNLVGGGLMTSKVEYLSLLLESRKLLVAMPDATFGAVFQLDKEIADLSEKLAQRVYKIAWKQLGATTRAEDIEQALRDILDSATFDYKDDRTRAVIAQAARALAKRDHSMPAVLGAPYKLSSVRQFIQGE
jgi:hypothetical protein